jgi:hypothetical protein
VSLDYYRRESVKIAQLFKECSPGVEIGESENEIPAIFCLTLRIKKRHLSMRRFLTLQNPFETYYSNDIHI